MANRLKQFVLKLGIMQPYFFPYLGYFELMNRTDEFVTFDTVQYIRHGWMNRNRILKPNGDGWSYITVPLQKHPQEILIKDVLVVGEPAWRQQILRQIEHYKKAPFYSGTRDAVAESLENDILSLSKLNVHALGVFSKYLGIKFQPRFFSEMNLPIGPVDDSGDWALRISQAMGAQEYINPPGGVGLFKPEKWQEAGIKLTIQKQVDFRYSTRKYAFEPYMSIVDVCMWNSPESIKSYLDQYSYESDDG